MHIVFLAVDVPDERNACEHCARGTVFAADKDDVEKIAGDKEVAVKGDYGYAVFDGDAAVKFDKAIRIRTIA